MYIGPLLISLPSGNAMLSAAQIAKRCVCVRLSCWERERVRERTGALSWADKQVVVCCICVWVCVLVMLGYRICMQSTQRDVHCARSCPLSLSESANQLLCASVRVTATLSSQHSMKRNWLQQQQQQCLTSLALLCFRSPPSLRVCVCVWWQSVSRRQLSEFCCCCVSIEISFDMFGCTRSRRNPS